MGIKKPFDRSLYEEFDAKAKKAALKLFKKFPELTVYENPKKRGVDLIIEKNGKIVGYAELETTRLWKSDTFPYLVVNIPERKEKYCNQDKPTLFIMFSANYKNYLVITEKDLLKSKKEVVSNKCVKWGEEFYRVALNSVYFNGLEVVLKKMRLI